MVQKIIWTKQARNNLAEIKNYIALDSLYYAKRIIYLIYQSCNQLIAQPEIGMALYKQDSYILRRVLIKKYRVIYTIHSQAIYIIAVYHQARMLPAKFDMPVGLFE
jgi:toxin ParE1/3/4